MAVSAVKKETAKKQDAADSTAAPASTPKKNSKYLKLLSFFIIASGVAGAGGYWYLKQGKTDKPAETKLQPAKPPVYVPLETFTVNLQLEESPQFLQTGLSLKVSDSTVVEALKIHMPEVRNRVLLLLSSRKASELLTVAGKNKLSADIVDAINAILAPAAPKEVAPDKAPTESKPPANGDTAAPTVAEEKPPQETVAPEPATAVAAAPVPAAQTPVVAVLFTSFIVQ